MTANVVLELEIGFLNKVLDLVPDIGKLDVFKEILLAVIGMD